MAIESEFELEIDERRRAEYETLVRRQLELLGEDPSRVGLARTPLRVTRSMAWLTRGYEIDLKRIAEIIMVELVVADAVEPHRRGRRDHEIQR